MPDATQLGRYHVRVVPEAGYVWSNSDIDDPASYDREPVEYSWVVEKEIEVPTETSSLDYTGEAQTPSFSGDAATYVVAVDPQTDAGTYSATITPAGGYVWAGSNGSREPRTVSWTINPKEVHVRANDASIHAGESVPALTYTSDVENAVTGTLALPDDADTTKPGEINILRGSLEPANGNYKIAEFSPGKLTVLEAEETTEPGDDAGGTTDPKTPGSGEETLKPELPGESETEPNPGEGETNPKSGEGDGFLNPTQPGDGSSSPEQPGDGDSSSKPEGLDDNKHEKAGTEGDADGSGMTDASEQNVVMSHAVDANALAGAGTKDASTTGAEAVRKAELPKTGDAFVGLAGTSALAGAMSLLLGLFRKKRS